MWFETYSTYENEPDKEILKKNEIENETEITEKDNPEKAKAFITNAEALKAKESLDSKKDQEDIKNYEKEFKNDGKKKIEKENWTQAKQNTLNKPKGFSDTVSAFFSSSMALDLKSMFYDLMSMFGKEENRDTYGKEAIFSKATYKLALGTKGQRVSNKEKESISYVEGLNQILLWADAKALEVISFKKRFAEANLGNQKEYIANALKSSEPFSGGMTDILGKELPKETETIVIKGLSETESNKESTFELKGELGKEYLVANGVMPIINDTVTLYDNNKENTSMVQKIITFKRNAWGNIIDTSVRNGKENLPMAFENTLDALQDADNFDLWKMKKVGTLDIKNNFPVANQERVEEIIIETRKELDSLWPDQRTEEVLKNILWDLKADLISQIPQGKEVDLQSLDKIDLI